MPAFNKKELSEKDICTKYITPSLLRAGWDIHSQIREEVTFTAGQIIISGKVVKRKKKKRADYILYYKPNIPIAVIEAKDNKHTISAGMQQALDYAEHLDIPFVFSSNGDGFQFHDKTIKEGPVEKELTLDEFPSPEELWNKYKFSRDYDSEIESAVTYPYFQDGSGKTPRYYQVNAINRTVEAIVKGQDRVLMVMATGTGKTFTAFQIIWRLWKAGVKKRILFLADRDVLIKQTRVNDFKPFGSAMTRIKNRKVDKSYEIYLSLYQAVTGEEDMMNIYKDFSPEFFDLIVIDECHRGSADEDSKWHQILTYFDKATHLGLTATPKETKEISNIHYFGDPIYTYSLKQGIEDGYLAPYKVIRIDLDKDIEGWRPEDGKRDKYGHVIEDRIYNQSDFDRKLVLDKRTEIVASKVTEFLRKTSPYNKSIIFCIDIDHAERMRVALVNQNGKEVAKNGKYVMRITGDSLEGKMELDNFIDPEQRYPVIATTSELLTTGVDAQTCQLIVLDQTIKSMTKFKQIIGRGTRINEEYGKFYFTIMDFRKATEQFADPAFDGPPIQVYEPKPDEPLFSPDTIVVPIEDEEDDHEYEIVLNENAVDDITDFSFADGEIGDSRPAKYYVDDVEVHVLGERIQYYGQDGRLITESLKDYTRKRVESEFESLDDFLQKWSQAEQKKAIIDELEENGVLFDALAEEVGRDYGPFDLICHVAFGQPPLTRQERANNVRKQNYFGKYSEKAQTVLNALLDKYADQGIENIEDITILKVPPFDEMGTIQELVIDAFGNKENYMSAIKDLKEKLYAA